MSTRASVLSVSILLTLAPVMPASAQDPGPCSSSAGCSPAGPSGLFKEWQLLTKAVNLADPWFGGGDPDDGWYAQFGDMITDSMTLSPMRTVMWARMSPNLYLCCRLSDFRPPHLSNSSPPLTAW